MSKATDIWQTGIVHRPIAGILRDGLDGAEVTWLPEAGSFRFNADPFGVWRDGLLTVFVEAYDYRDKRGEIHFYTYDSGRTLVEHGVALRRPFHLSYPQIIEDGGEIYMLPEGHRDGRLTLYRAQRFPGLWAPVCDLLDVPAVDASLIRHDGLWWMFYALPGADRRAERELHVAWAARLIGPWKAHSGNPVRTASDSARPGGTPFLHDGAIHLPVQDCSATYGGGLKVLRIDDLTPDRFSARVAAEFSPRGLHPDYPDGLHTLSEAGNVTLIDVKRLDRSSRLLVDIQRRWTRITGGHNAVTEIATTPPVETVRLPPCSGYEQMTARARGGAVSVLEGVTDDGFVVSPGHKVRTVSLPPCCGYSDMSGRADDSGTVWVLDGVRDASADAADMPEGFSIAPGASGTRQVFCDGRQQTYGPEDKTLLGPGGGDTAIIGIAAESAYQKETGRVRALRGPTGGDSRTIRVIIGIGQSLNLGASGRVEPANSRASAWLTEPPAPGRLLAMSRGASFQGFTAGGVSPFQNGVASWGRATPDLGVITDAASVMCLNPEQNMHDVPALTAALWVGEAHDWEGLYACVALGRGGTPLQALSKPETAEACDFAAAGRTLAELVADRTPSHGAWGVVTADPDRRNIATYLKTHDSGEGWWSRADLYRNGLRWLEAFNAQAAIQYPDHAVEVAYVPVILGEANVSLRTSQADYARMLEQFRRDFTADIKAITGQARDPVFGVGQTNTAVGNHWGPQLASLDRAVNGEGWAYWGPQLLDSYVYQVTGARDQSHLLPHGSTDLGEMAGRAYYNAVRGAPLQAIYPVHATRNGLFTTVVLHAPGMLALDPAIDDDGTLGAAWTDSANSSRIVSATLSGHTLTLRHNVEPRGDAAKVTFCQANATGFPGTRTGPRSPVRSVDAAYARTSGLAMPVRLSISEIDVR